MCGWWGGGWSGFLLPGKSVLLLVGRAGKGGGGPWVLASLLPALAKVERDPGSYPNLGESPKVPEQENPVPASLTLLKAGV